MEEKQKDNSWGGKREGAGRKRKYVKSVYFRATQEVLDILDSVGGSHTDFINACIVKAAAKE